MTGKQILDQVFGLTFYKGNYSGQLDKLDAQGMIGKKQILSILTKILEEIDEINVKLEATASLNRPGREEIKKTTIDTSKTAIANAKPTTTRHNTNKSL